MVKKDDDGGDMCKQYMLFIAAVLMFTFCLGAQSMAQSKVEPLSEKQKSIILIAAFTANGDINRLKSALNDGLDAGLTINEIKDILVQMYAYAGFPRSLNGIGAFMAVLDERKTQGIEDAPGREASLVPSDMDKSVYGAKVRAQLIGMENDMSGQPWQKFAPAIDTFLKEHLFADIFARDVLDYKSREIATIGALAAMSGTRLQLQSHLGFSLNVGWTPFQLHDFAGIVETVVGSQEGANVKEALGAVLKAREQK